MIGHAQGELLGQVRPAVTTPVTLFTAGTLRTEITLLIATVIPGSVNTNNIVVYHDDDGSTYDNDSLLFTLPKSVTADGVIFQAQHPGSGLFIRPGGSIGVQCSFANDVAFKAYGITENVAERVRGIQP